MSIITINTARIFLPLLTPARYKGAYGGRGSGKSHFFAGLLIEDCLTTKGLRAVCIREVQKSLKDSVKRLIEDKLTAFGLGPSQGFKTFKEVIETPGDGLIIFQGLTDHTAQSIKSLEGFSRAWVEEAQTLSARSLELLRPTIRADGSELWFSWNPRKKTDPVDAMLRGVERPSSALVVRANWNANPWLPRELMDERADCMRANPDQYAHIWEGDYALVVAGAYYAAALSQARQEGRIAPSLALDPLMPLKAFWDIGLRDATAIWVAQFVGREVRVVDYYEAIGQPLAAHLAWLRAEGYEAAECILPHDGARADAATAIRFEDHIRAASFKVRTVPNQGAGAALKRVEASRRLFPALWFHGPNCNAGLEALGWYHERRDETRNIGLGPNHDWSSHAADAFGLMAVAYEEPRGPRVRGWSIVSK